VLKYGLLEGEELLNELERSAGSIAGRDPDAVAPVIERCVRHKARVVESDELDRGGRAVLNLGHTTAHALEKVLGFGAIGHGTAVALGLIVTLAVSEQTLGLDHGLRERVQDLMRVFGLPLAVRISSTAALVEATGLDKKMTGKGLGFVGLAAPGEPVPGLVVPAGVLERALRVISA
jgi:3-dehydroquinate synthase